MNGNSEFVCCHLCQAFGYKPGVKPGSIASAGSFCANNDNAKTSDDSQTPTLRSSKVTSKTRSSRTPVVTHNLRRQTKTHHPDRVLQTLHRMHEENKALAAERMATQRAMHEQKIALFGQFLDVLKAATSSNSIDAS